MQNVDVSIFMIGAGSMAEAFIRGVTEKGAVDPSHIRVINRSCMERPRRLKELYGVEIAKGWQDVAEADLVFVAVKPYDVPEAISQALPYLQGDSKGQTVISFAAGVTVECLERLVEGRATAVRTMPNIPVAVGSGVTTIAWGQGVSHLRKHEIQFLLSHLGSVVELPEDMMDAATAFTGSGPGLVSYILESMEKAAVQIGFEPDMARQMLIDTVIGTTRTLTEWGLSPEELRRKVTSPNGTTHAGVQSMQNDGLDDTILHALQSATVRSAEISKSFNDSEE